MRRSSRYFQAWVQLGIVLCLLSPVMASDLYKVIKIRPVHGDNSVPRAINSAGFAAGGSGEPHGGNTSGFLWKHGESALRLPGLADTDYSEAFAVDAFGNVAGSSNTSTSLRAVQWSEGKIHVLELPKYAGSSEAKGINDLGSIVGYVSGRFGTHACLWTATSVRLLDGGSLQEFSQATAINNKGQVVGFTSQDAFLWTTEAGMSLLEQIPGAESSQANAINDEGQIAGRCVINGSPSACFWDPGREARNLGPLYGGEYSEAFGINNQGKVVGAADTPLGLRAFIWTSGDGMRDLNQLIPSNTGIVLSAAVAINAKGEILAYGSVNHDLEHDRIVELDHGIHAGPVSVFLLTPFGLSSD